MIGSKVTGILLNVYILPIDGVASGRVCACSLPSRLVSKQTNYYLIHLPILGLKLKKYCLNAVLDLLPPLFLIGSPVSI